MAEEQNSGADVSASIVQGSESADITTTSAEVEAAKANADAVGPDSFGVTQSQFDKYYKDGNYNWEAHAKELQFIAEQRGTDNQQTQQEEGQQEVAEDAQQAVEQAGLDWDELSFKIGSQGDIDIEDYNKLMAMGIPEETIRGHVQMVAQQVQTHVAAVTDAFGGQEQWQQTQAWADRNLSEGEIAHLNQMLAGPDYKMAVDMIKQRAGTQMSNMPQTNPGTNQVTPYGSQAEMIADMRKPEYKRDPAFRQQVQARVGASQLNMGGHTL